MSFLFGRRGSVLTPQNECDRKLIHKDDLAGLQERWVAAAAKTSPTAPALPKAALQEMAKRIADARPLGKAKLNLSSCKLTDPISVALVQALAEIPLIAKIDLSGDNSLTTESVELLLKLLRGQCKIVSTVHVDSRRDAAFLGEVQLPAQCAKSAGGTVSDKKIFEVQARTECLKHVNTMSNIRRACAERKSDSAMSAAIFREVWIATVGTMDEEWIQATLKKVPAGGVLPYTEAESAILEACVIKGHLPRLQEWQVVEITYLSEEDFAAAEAEVKAAEAEYNRDRLEQDRQLEEAMRAQAGNRSPSTEKATRRAEKKAEKVRVRLIGEIRAFYEAHNPDRLQALPGLLEKYRGREESMLVDLHRKYNVTFTPRSYTSNGRYTDADDESVVRRAKIRLDLELWGPSMAQMKTSLACP
jgi:hypothetical protein